MAVQDQPYKNFNFRKLFYQRVTYYKILVSKTILGPLKTLKYAEIKVSRFKPISIHRQDNI